VNLMQRALSGNRVNIDDEIDAWHDSTYPGPLHEYLGMSWEEYTAWLEKRSTIEDIVIRRRLSEESRVGDLTHKLGAACSTR